MNIITLLILFIVSLGYITGFDVEKQDLAYRKPLFHVMPNIKYDGWVHTINQYYTGMDSLSVKKCVKCMLDDMIKILEANPNHKLYYLEMVYFEKWYNEQTDLVKQKVKDYVNTGRITFPNGGWVINDEISSYYDDIIEQMILGHRFLLNEFNYVPRIGWNINNIGHSSAQANLYSQMGFNMVFMDIINFEHNDITNTMNYEFIWRPFDKLHENYILAYLYHSRHETPIQLTNPRANASSKKANAVIITLNDLLNEYYTEHYQQYKTNNLLCLIPEDHLVMIFNMNDLNQSSIQGNNSIINHVQSMYIMMDEVIDQMNENKYYGVNAWMSTPENFAVKWYSEYMMNESIRLKIKKDDDMYAYNEKQNRGRFGYWTGYYTSKANFKLNVKVANSYLNNFRKIYTKHLLEISNCNNTSINIDCQYPQRFTKIDNISQKLEKALSVAQHHEVLSGISTLSASQDYVNMINDAIGANLKLISDIAHFDIQNLYNESISFDICNMNSSFELCEKLFRTLDSVGSTMIRIFNPGKSSRLILRLRIPYENIEIYNEYNTMIYSEKICHPDFYYDTKTFDCDLYFEDDFKEFGYNHYKLVKSFTASGILHSITIEDLVKFEEKRLRIDNRTNFTIGEDLKTFEISFCKSGGLNLDIDIDTTNIDDMANTVNPDDISMNCISEIFNLDYMYYKSFYSMQESTETYEFIPYNPNVYQMQRPYEVWTTQGILITEIIIRRDKLIDNESRVLTKIKLYKNHIEKGIELESHLFPLIWDDNHDNGDVYERGREIIMKIRSSSIDNKNLFYTDANGMYMVKRSMKYIPEYDPYLFGNMITGNYYPIASCIYIEDMDTGLRMSLLNDRIQGGSSLHHGEIEFMLHRRTLPGDNRITGDAVDEYEIIENGDKNYEISPIHVRTQHILQFSNERKGFPSQQRETQYRKDNSPLILYGNSEYKEFAKSRVEQTFSDNELFGGLNNIIKISIRSYLPNEYIVRLHNLNDENTIKLGLIDNTTHKNYLLTRLLQQNHSVITYNTQELSLSTNQLKSHLLYEKYTFREVKPLDLDELLTDDYSLITLRPQELRTFKFSNISFYQ